MKKFIGYMRGVNLGGWLSQCKHTEEHYSSFIKESDIKEIAEWGLDHVRLPIDAQLIENDGAFIESGFGHINDCLAWCKKYGLNVILDLHKTPGYSFFTPDENTLFEDEKLQDRYLNLWRELAKRYCGYGERVAFELLNEIVEQNSERWNKLARKVIAAIREIAPDTKIVIGGIRWNNAGTLKYLDVPLDDNIVYTFHFYEPFLFTHQKARWIDKMPSSSMEYPATIEKYREVSAAIQCHDSGYGTISEMGTAFLERIIIQGVQTAEEKNVILYCGEYGVDDYAPTEDTLNWYRDVHSVLEKYGIGRAAWTYKKMNFGIADEHYEPVRKGIIAAL